VARLALVTHASQVPWYDDRRTAAQAALNATGPDHANPDTLLAVLSTKPVLNLMTTYSIVAQPKTADVFNHFVRYCAPSALHLLASSHAVFNQAMTLAPTEREGGLSALFVFVFVSAPRKALPRSIRLDCLLIELRLSPHSQ
jgi:hypothetical protein